MGKFLHVVAYVVAKKKETFSADHWDDSLYEWYRDAFAFLATRVQFLEDAHVTHRAY